MDGYSGEDVFSFLNKNKEEVHRYLSSERLSHHDGYKTTEHGQGNNYPPLARNFHSQQSSLNKFVPTNKQYADEIMTTNTTNNNNSQYDQISMQNNPNTPKNKLSSFANNNNSTANNLNALSMGNYSLAAVLNNNPSSSTFNNSKLQ